MRAELPWNVAGIPPEAREAARAAARREGLSVGEWLTRHILHDFSEVGDETSRSLQGPPALGGETPDDGTGSGSADSEATRAGEAGPDDAWRRVEEQLRGLGRRLDTSERSHNDSNRFLSRTAQEMNANAREQAQAFDQLGHTLGSLRERLERLERTAPGNNIREAIKALHLGLSRLADQLTVTAGKSAGQLAEVMGNVEKLAVHIGKVREDSDSAARLLNQRIDLAQDELAQRLQDGEKSLAARLSAAEKTTLFNTNALDHALEKIEAAATARAAELAENQRRASQQEEILRELKDGLAQLEARLPGLKLESRLNGIERSIGGLKEAVAQRDPALAFGVTVQDLAQRLERLERDQAGLSDALHKTPAEDAAASQFPHASLEPLVEVPPEPHIVAPDLPQGEMPAGEALQPPEATEQDIAMPAFFFASGSEEPVPQEDALEDRHMAFAPRDYAFIPQAQAEEDEPDILFQEVIVESNPDALLAEARRSAQAALERAEGERIFRRPSFHAGEVATDDEESPKPRYWIPLAAVLVLAIVASAALVLSQRAKRLGEELAASNPLAEKIPVLPMLPPGKPMVAPAAGAPASEPDGDQTAEIPPTARKVEHATLSADANQPAAIAAPDAAKNVNRKTIASAGADRVVQLATAGNPVALTILGLKALEGTSSAPANLPDAVKFLTQAADKGQAVAQYRLGTLYERGQGVATDPAKAMHLYELAADQGNRKAMHNLAVAYASGPAGKRNMTLAARWFAKAAALGLADSQFNLAVLCERGEGVPQSLPDAYKWYAIAALTGDGEAKARMGVLDTQLSESDRAAANKSAASFHASPLIRSVNVPPEPADLGG